MSPIIIANNNNDQRLENTNHGLNLMFSPPAQTQVNPVVRMENGIVNLERIVTDKANHFILGIKELS